MGFPVEGEDVWIEDYFGTVMSIYGPFKSANIRDADGNPLYGREVTIFIEGDEEWDDDSE